LKAYRRFPKEEVLDIFPTYFYGPVDKFPAPKAIIFQRGTQFLSYTVWLFFLIAFLVVRRKYLRVRDNIFVQKNRIPASMDTARAGFEVVPDYAA
ncbi:MAG TPA: hypothetical protein VKB95_14500, partial [Chitinophagaceae bacterium]|nr:hypothetical protein [Chitinophagaceae bacterium]